MRFYRLTPAGRKQLEAELSDYGRRARSHSIRFAHRVKETAIWDRVFRRLRYLLHRRRFDRELAGDMEFHREMAAREGSATFGNTLRLREEARDAWGWTWLDRFRRTFATRRACCGNRPASPLAAVLMLAIGIGVNVAAFRLLRFDGLRPLNVRDPATLLRFHRRSPQNYAFALPYPEMAFFREHSQPSPPCWL